MLRIRNTSSTTAKALTMHNTSSSVRCFNKNASAVGAKTQLKADLSFRAMSQNLTKLFLLNMASI